MEIIPPEEPNKGKESGGSYHIHLHNPELRANDIDAYRRLATDCGEEFAKTVLESNERRDKRQVRSMTVGMVVAGIVLVSLLGAVTASIVFLGWWQSIATVAVILALALLARVLLTGEWSDTSWFGQFISGGRPKGGKKDDGADT